MTLTLDRSTPPTPPDRRHDPEAPTTAPADGMDGPDRAPAPSPTRSSCRTMRFEDLDIRYDAAVLEPRRWTALQSRWATELLEGPDQRPGAVLELCAGAGHIGLAAIRPTNRSLVQVDANPRACAWAEHNATAAGLAHRVSIRSGDVADVLGAHERFPLVIADPPYVPTDDVGEHPDDPRIAIDGGADGLDVVRRVMSVAADHLTDDGVVLLQTRGAGQLVDVSRACAGGLAARDGRYLRLAAVRSRGTDRAVGLYAWATRQP